MVEQRTENPCVDGSIPPLGTIFLPKKTPGRISPELFLCAFAEGYSALTIWEQAFSMPTTSERLAGTIMVLLTFARLPNCAR